MNCVLLILLLVAAQPRDTSGDAQWGVAASIEAGERSASRFGQAGVGFIGFVGVAGNNHVSRLLELRTVTGVLGIFPVSGPFNWSLGAAVFEVEVQLHLNHSYAMGLGARGGVGLAFETIFEDSAPGNQYTQPAFAGVLGLELSPAMLRLGSEGQFELALTASFDWVSPRFWVAGAGVRFSWLSR